MRLSKISKQMAELDFSGQCTAAREDELGCLAQNLNSLSASLSTALNDLQTANQQLKTDTLYRATPTRVSSTVLPKNVPND